MFIRLFVRVSRPFVGVDASIMMCLTICLLSFNFMSKYSYTFIGLFIVDFISQLRIYGNSFLLDLRNILLPEISKQNTTSLLWIFTKNFDDRLLYEVTQGFLVVSIH